MNKITIKAQMINYSNDVISGKIIACKKHKWACMRFLRDLEREGTPDFPYIFDEAKADRFFKFASLFTHLSGVLAGKQIVPEPIHIFIFGNVYGWININTGYRRFNKFYWQVARKNSKSQWLAIVGLYETMAFNETGDTVNQVFCIATKSEQAKIVWNEARKMLDKCKLLDKKYRVAYSNIIHERSGSFMRVLSDEDRKKGDGLNPQCGIIDEYHAQETSEAYDIISSGMGARPQPLIAIITTAGFDLRVPCYQVEYDLVSKILNPDIDVNIENYFAIVNELDKNETTDTIDIDGRKIAPGELIDDIFDEKVWPKANPIICSYEVGMKYLRDEAQTAKLYPEKLRNFKTKHMNIWINQRDSGFMDMARWKACEAELPDLRGKTCYLGGDLSAKLDLSSIAFEFPNTPEDGIYTCISHSFMPEETYEAKCKSDKVDYKLWVEQGWLTLTPGAVIDYSTIKKWYQEYARANEWFIAEHCFDPWGNQQLAGVLIDEGETVVEIIQGIRTLSEPTKDFRNMVYSKRIRHNGNPVLSWAMSNAVVDVVDRNENIILNKKKSRERIDPVAALINCHVRSMLCEETSVYNKRGLRSLRD